MEDGPAYVPSAKSIIPGINKLKQLFLDKGLPVILTQHMNTEENAGMMTVRWKELMHKNHPHIMINQEILCPGCEVLVTPQFYASFGTSQQKKMKDNGIAQLIITGVMANLCCETTVRSAFGRGFEPFFPIDGTAAYNYDFHLSTFKNLSYGFTNPVMIDGLKNALAQ
jgi:isochorismate hydrolase